MDLPGFISALFNDWISRMSGGASILFAALGFIPYKKFGFFKNPAVQRKVFWGMALLCFFLASISVWTNENQKVIRLEKEISNSSPNFKMEVLQVFYASLARKDIMAFYMNISIRNLGAPSKVGALTLSIGSLFPNEIIYPTDIKGEQYYKDGKIVAHFQPNNSLAIKLNDLILRGDNRAGWVRFMINCRDIDPQKIINANKVVSIHDMFDHKYSFDIDSNKYPKTDPGRTYIFGTGEQPFPVTKKFKP